MNHFDKIDDNFYCNYEKFLFFCLIKTKNRYIFFQIFEDFMKKLIK